MKIGAVSLFVRHLRARERTDIIDVDRARWCKPTDCLPVIPRAFPGAFRSLWPARWARIRTYSYTQRECEANGFVGSVDDDDGGGGGATSPWVIFVRRSRSVRGTWA